MARYIRTKDGIIDTERITIGGIKLFHLTAHDASLRDGWYWDLGEFGIDLEVEDKDILKQANTIKELCDDFFLVANKLYGFGSTINERGWHGGYSSFEKCKEDYDYVKDYSDVQDLTLYGAILTDKGLIFKAKMKGVLPNGEIDWELL